MKLHTRVLARINSMQNEGGATAVEYGLMVSLIALFIVGAVTGIGIALDTFFDGVLAGL